MTREDWKLSQGCVWVWLPMRWPAAWTRRTISGTLTDEAADHEEGGLGVVAGEEIEERVGGNVVRAVVVGERYFCGVVAGDYGVAEELRAGAETRVGKGKARGGGDDQGCSC